MAFIISVTEQKLMEYFSWMMCSADDLHQLEAHSLVTSITRSSETDKIEYGHNRGPILWFNYKI